MPAPPPLPAAPAPKRQPYTYGISPTQLTPPTSTYTSPNQLEDGNQYQRAYWQQVDAAKQRSSSDDQQDKDGDDDKEEETDEGIPRFLMPFQRPWDVLYAYLATLDMESYPMYFFLAGMCLLVGILDVLITGMNIQLFSALKIGSSDYASLKASFIAFAIGLACVVAALLAQPRQLFQKLPMVWTKRAEIPIWMFLGGGVTGAIFLSLAVLVAAKQGVGAFFTALIAGQQALSFVVESGGWLGFKKLPIDRIKIGGFALLIAGQLLYQNYNGHVPPGDEAAFIFAGLVAGVSQLLGANINSEFAKKVDSYLVVQVISEGISVAILAVGFGLSFIAEPLVFNDASVYWMWFGGSLGSFVITAATILPKLVGNSTFSVTNITGQLLISVIATFTNFLNLGAKYSGMYMLIGGLILGVVGAAIISYQNQRLTKQQEEEEEEDDDDEGDDEQKQKEDDQKKKQQYNNQQKQISPFYYDATPNVSPSGSDRRIDVHPSPYGHTPTAPQPTWTQSAMNTAYAAWLAVLG